MTDPAWVLMRHPAAGEATVPANTVAHHESAGWQVVDTTAAAPEPGPCLDCQNKDDDPAGPAGPVDVAMTSRRSTRRGGTTTTTVSRESEEI